jgi:hypothetical protein
LFERSDRHRHVARTKCAVRFHPLDHADLAGPGKKARGRAGVAVQFHRSVEMPLHDTDAVSQFLRHDVEKEGRFQVAAVQGATPVRLDEALVKDDFHDTLSESASRSNVRVQRALGPCFYACRCPKTAAHFWATCMRSRM